MRVAARVAVEVAGRVAAMEVARNVLARAVMVELAARQ